MGQEQVNRRVNKEMDAIRKTANYRYSTSKRARGKLKQLMDENKKAAHEEVQMLNKLFTNKLNKVRAKANSDARAAGNDLKKKTKALYGRLAQVQLHALALNKQNSKHPRLRQEVPGCYQDRPCWFQHCHQHP